jgi:hypothetical protein
MVGFLKVTAHITHPCSFLEKILKELLTIKSLKDPINFYSDELLRLIQDSVQIFN